MCGWLHEGETPPEKCPRCGATADKFELVDLSELDTEDTVQENKVRELSPEDKKRIEQALFKISYGLYIVGSFSGDKINAQTCNTVFQITSAPMRVAIGINKNNLTHQYIKDSGFFSVCILGSESLKAVQNFGFKSGRDKDKFEGVAHTIGSTGAPVLDECIGFMEFRVNQALTVDAGTHTLFMGDVVDGRATRQDAEPLTYAGYRESKKKGTK